MKTERLFEIIYILLNRKSVPARQLAEELGVSRRTICRDVDTLSMAGIPIYTERGNGGGISLMPDFVLNKSLLSEQEQSEILSALHGMSNIKTTDTNQVLRKLSKVFNKHPTNWIEIDFSEWSNENDHFNDFKTAIFEWFVVEFDYYNSYGDKTFRRVEPIQLWYKSNFWYLKGFCLEKQEMRLYKLLRIKNLVVTEEHFSHRDSHIVDVDPSHEQYKDDPEIPLVLRIEPEKAYRVFDVFHESMVKKQQDGGFIVAVSWPDNNWLYDFILSFGEHITVVEPEHIREKVRSAALKLMEKHGT